MRLEISPIVPKSARMCWSSSAFEGLEARNGRPRRRDSSKFASCRATSLQDLQWVSIKCESEVAASGEREEKLGAVQILMLGRAPEFKAPLMFAAKNSGTSQIRLLAAVGGRVSGAGTSFRGASRC